MPDPVHTSEQLAILEAMAETSDHLIIRALAGTGKTTTLLDGLPSLRGDTLFMAFNRSIADELRHKSAAKLSFEALSRVNVTTVHSHGLRAFNRTGLRAKTLDGKTMFMLKDILEASSFNRNDDVWRNLGKITRLVGAAKSAGFGLSSSFEYFPSIDNLDGWEALAEHYDIEEDLAGSTSLDTVIGLARKLLKQSNERTNSIDFDDMIYLPLLLNLPIPVYDNVMIDEAQDINATRRELAFRSLAPPGRMIAVGDSHQAIYGFTGADVASLDNIERRCQPAATVLPLTICWRCDGEIIRSAQQQVPAIRCRPGAEDAGQVITIDFAEDNFLDRPRPGDAILCRINKPNVAVCLGLLRRGIRARIEGRDIGKRLEHHVQKAAPLYASQSLSDTLLDLDTYREQEIAKFVAKNKPESAIAMLEDEIDAAALILERALELSLKFPSSCSLGVGCREAGVCYAEANGEPNECGANPGTYADFVQLLNELFGDDVSWAYVTLSSIHKAKGREWPTVFILGYADWMPHHMAKMHWEQVQEQNLIYVAKTRARRNLILVNGAQSAIDKGLHRELPKSATPAERAFAAAQRGEAMNNGGV